MKSILLLKVINKGQKFVYNKVQYNVTANHTTAGRPGALYSAKPTVCDFLKNIESKAIQPIHPFISDQMINILNFNHPQD